MERDEQIETPDVLEFDGDHEDLSETVSLNRQEKLWTELLESLVRERKDTELTSFIKEVYSSDIADFIEKMEQEDGLYLFRHLPPDEQGDVLYEFEDHVRDRYLRDILNSSEVAAIILEQPSDRAADILAELDLESVSRVLARIPYEDRVKVTELLSYPENTAGALMTKDFVAVQQNDTAKKAISTLRRASERTDDIQFIYVVDEEGAYKGHISLKQLILSRPQSRVKRIMKEELLPIRAYTDREDVANFFTRYDFIAAPVIDDRGVLLGRITADDILEVLQEEASEDILRMGGVSGEERLTTPLLRTSLQRVVWLAVNLGTAFLSASVIQVFEKTIEKVVLLAALMPIVAALGGSAANQTVALVVRNIALGELTDANTRSTVTREITIGLINGIIIGLIAGIIIFLVTGNQAIALVILLALLFNLLVASFVGTMVPVFLRKVKVDPAIASSMMVATCTDVMGFSLFLGLASVLLHITGTT